MARQVDTTETISAVPGSEVSTGFYRSGGAFYQSSSTSSDAWLRYAIGHSAESPYSTTNTSNTYVKDGTNDSNTTGWMDYPFDFSEIPSSATISSVEVKVYGAAEDTSQTSAHAEVELYSGSTKKSTTQKFTSTSNSTITVSSPGTWTRTELQSAKLRFIIGYYGGRIFGATWKVTYNISGYMYEIVATSSISGYTVEPSSQEIFQGGSGEIRIDGATLTNVVVTDNNSDVTSSLVQHEIESGGSKSTVLGSYSLVSGGFNGSGATYFSGIVGHGVDASTTTSNYYSSGSGTIAVFTYDLEFDDIPSNATITALTCQVNGHAESTSNSNEYMCAQLICGSTELSSELNFKSIGTSNSTQTLTATTLPTVSQLSNLKLQCRLGYYGGAINGATATITYTVPNSGNNYYWTYTINNIAADHTVVVKTSGGNSPQFYIKINGAWTQVAKIYKKVNGSWVEQSSSAWDDIFDTNVTYRIMN